MDSIISVLKSTIETAIQSGAMQPPSVSEAAAISGGLQTTTTAAEANSATTAYETAKPIPASVEQSVKGAESQVAAFADCDSSIAGKSITTCARAVTKILFSGLNFPVLLKVGSGGAFNAEFVSGGGCSSGNGDITNLFPNATFANDMDHGITGFCLISPKLGEVNRNRGDERYGGRDGGMAFTETGAVSGSNDGVITALATAMFNKNVYRLANIDQIMFGYDSGTDSGMNARIFHMSRITGTSGELADSTFRYKDSTGTWTTIPSILWRDSAISYCTSADCDVLPRQGDDDLRIPYASTAKEWTSANLSGRSLKGSPP